MTAKRLMIQSLLNDGKSYAQICFIMRITPANLHSTIYQMREANIPLAQQAKPRVNRLSPAQRLVLYGYSRNRPVADIAKELCIKPQTVMNIASEGRKRLGLTLTGEAQILALQNLFPTMEDPFFN